MWVGVGGDVGHVGVVMWECVGGDVGCGWWWGVVMWVGVGVMRVVMWVVIWGW